MLIYKKIICFHTDYEIERYVSTIKIDIVKEKERERLLKSNELFMYITTNNLSDDEMLKLFLKDFKFFKICSIDDVTKYLDFLAIDIAININDDMTFKDLKYIADYFDEDLVIPCENEEVFLFDGYYE